MNCMKPGFTLCGGSKDTLDTSVKSPSVNKSSLSPEGKAALVEHGWDKGYVAFGFSASETTVKVATALSLTGIDVQWVTVSFDGSDLEDIPEDFDPNMITPGSKQKLGVKSELFSLITGGKPMMPALAIDGVVYTESEGIVKMLAEKEEISDKEKNVELIELSAKYNEPIFQALKHWGWAGLHAYQNYSMVNKEHYVSYGQGNQTEEWEKEKTDAIKEFMGALEEILKAKPKVNGFFIGDSRSFADAALINWVQSLEGVAGLDVKKYYPNCHENWGIIKASPPDGSAHFIYGFPVFCGYVTQANQHAREAGFDINKYWE